MIKLKNLFYPIYQSVFRGLNALPLGSRLLIRETVVADDFLDHPTAKVRLRLESKWERAARAFACRKEPETVQWIETIIQAGDTVVDIGANVGSYSLLIDKIHQGKCSVLSFEPSAANYAQLQRNIAINGSSDTVKAFPVALSDQTGLSALQLSDLVPGSALHQVASEQSAAFRFTQTCLCYRLDDFLREFYPVGVNHIKLDVDGHEVAVLEGAEVMLKNPALKSVLIEIDDGSGNREPVFERLQAAGLILAGDRHTHCAEGSRFGNFLFVRPNPA
jgi:FkbM family methyltransferase